jgi:hypothetical protein
MTEDLQAVHQKNQLTRSVSGMTVWTLSAINLKIIDTESRKGVGFIQLKTCALLGRAAAWGSHDVPVLPISNRCEFSAEINIHFPGMNGLIMWTV